MSGEQEEEEDENEVEEKGQAEKGGDETKDGAGGESKVADAEKGGGQPGPNATLQVEVAEEVAEENWGSAFGVVTLASLFPIISVLILALVSSTLATAEEIEAEVAASRMEADAAAAAAVVAAAAADGAEAAIDIWERTPLREAADGSRAVLPLVAFLVLTLRGLLATPLPTVFLPQPLNPDGAAPKSETTLHLAWGLLTVLAGIVVFYVGLNLGLLPLGTGVGDTLPHAFTNYTLSQEAHPEWMWLYFNINDPHPEHFALYERPVGIFLVAVFAFVMGFGATCAEPALNTLGLTVERLTKGVFDRKMLITAVSFGVGTGLTIGVLRLIFNVKLIYILLPAYSVALVLTFFASEEYVCVAWDSAGVTTGPITVPLVISMGLGLGDALMEQSGESIDCFGILACASVSPIIAVLGTGIYSGCAGSGAAANAEEARRLVSGAAASDAEDGDLPGPRGGCLREHREILCKAAVAGTVLLTLVLIGALLGKEPPLRPAAVAGNPAVLEPSQLWLPGLGAVLALNVSAARAVLADGAVVEVLAERGVNTEVPLRWLEGPAWLPAAAGTGGPTVFFTDTIGASSPEW